MEYYNNILYKKLCVKFNNNNNNNEIIIIILKLHSILSFNII